MKTFREYLTEAKINESVEYEETDKYKDVYFNNGFKNNGDLIKIGYVGYAQNDVSIKVYDADGSNPHFYLYNKSSFSKIKLKSKQEYVAEYLESLTSWMLSTGIAQYGSKCDIASYSSDCHEYVVVYDPNGSPNKFTKEKAKKVDELKDKISKKLKLNGVTFEVSTFTSSRSFIIKSKFI